MLGKRGQNEQGTGKQGNRKESGGGGIENETGRTRTHKYTWSENNYPHCQLDSPPIHSHPCSYFIVFTSSSLFYNFDVDHNIFIAISKFNHNRNWFPFSLMNVSSRFGFFSPRFLIFILVGCLGSYWDIDRNFIILVQIEISTEQQSHLDDFYRKVPSNSSQYN